MTVGELKEFIEDLPNDMIIYITSDDNMPVKRVVDISSEIRVPYYKELYIEVESEIIHLLSNPSQENIRFKTQIINGK